MQLTSFANFVHQSVMPKETPCVFSDDVDVFCFHCVTNICGLFKCKAKDKQLAVSNDILLTFFFSVLAFAGHVGFLSMAALLCIHQQKMGTRKRWRFCYEEGLK